MERALNLDILRLALGDGPMLPSAEDLQRRVGEAEIALFRGGGVVDDELLATAWYLHAVGSARQALQLYAIDRQLRANQVAAHIFDLALTNFGGSDTERLEMAFAAQVSYLRGSLDPNSLAIYRRVERTTRRLRDDPGLVSLEVGSALLALERAWLFRRTSELRAEAEQLQQTLGGLDLVHTPYAAAARVVEACRDLLVHLTYNRPERLARALRLLEEAINASPAEADLDSRWVAAHLMDIGGNLGGSSVWSILPPTVPQLAGSAMTLGDPPILSLWPPQLDFLRSDPSPLEPQVRRIVLCFPTSAGKTLLAQYLVAAHVASGSGSACVVAPTHSLVREIRRDLDRRLAVFALQSIDAGPIGLPLPVASTVTVMTPEKFAAHMRLEPERMLSDYSLFLFDEAHLIGDSDRGWILESALSFLHSVTRNSAHRIALLSAALGNRAHITAWLDPGDGSLKAFQHDWRGPRRVHAIFTTEPDWNAGQEFAPTRRGALARRRTPLNGVIHIRTGPAQHTALTTTEPIGDLVQVNRQGVWDRSDETTPAYRTRARIANYLAQHGPLLAIEATKVAAQRTAEAIAEDRSEDDPATGALVSLATTRLGEDHPLVATLRRGIGFHHSALPDDVQAELEDALRTGRLDALVATTTLVEGINFPVRTVLIGDRGYRGAGGFVETLDRARLLNAMGRAGRAGRETEGWVVLALQRQFNQSAFDELEQRVEDLATVSRLATADALDALAEFEDLQRSSEDAVIEFTGRAVSDFVSHVWFVATALEDLNRATDAANALSLESTLAWQQLDDGLRARWRRLSDAALASYLRQPRERRRRWARAGMSIPSASVFERLSEGIRAELADIVAPWEPVEAFVLVAQSGRLTQILGVAENRFRGFRPRRNSPLRDRIDVNVESVALGWLQGEQLRELGETHLHDVPDETYRYEQLSEFISATFEHLLPWALSTIVGWANEGRPEDEMLCPDLPAYVRYGVQDSVALALMKGGVRSRRLAHTVGRLSVTRDQDDVRVWLGSMDIGDWRTSFDATPSELADLLSFTGAREAHLTSRALAGEAIDVAIVVEDRPSLGGVQLQLMEEDPPARIAAWRGDVLVGTIGPRYHEDMRTLLAVGVPLVAELVAADTLRIRVRDPLAEPDWFSDSS